MKYRKLGSTNIKVSEIGFGSWQLGSKLWNGAKDEKAIYLVEKALDMGCNFFDTAPGYGEGSSEKLLGEALKGKRDKVVIVSKFGHTPEGETDFSASRIKKGIERSLKALQTDYLDGILLHNPPDYILEGKQEHYEVFEKLKKEGLIRSYGASVDTSSDLKRVMNNSNSQIAEVYFHALHQEMALAFHEANEKEIGLIVKVPLDSGWLAGKYNEDTKFTTGYRERWSEESKKRRANYVNQLRFLEKEDQTMAQGALRFILSYLEISTVIPGSRNLKYLKNNIKASDGELDKASIKKIQDLWNEAIKQNPLSW